MHHPVVRRIAFAGALVLVLAGVVAMAGPSGPSGSQPGSEQHTGRVVASGASADEAVLATSPEGSSRALSKSSKRYPQVLLGLAVSSLVGLAALRRHHRVLGPTSSPGRTATWPAGLTRAPPVPSLTLS